MTGKKLLFVINPASGSHNTNWKQVIGEYFADKNYSIELFELPEDCNIKMVQERISALEPDIVIAVGGDGTVKLVAECLLQKNILLGILPGGSANGLAKELGISEKPVQALDTLVKNNVKKIHLVKINGQLCIHLSDVGFNAFVVKEFESTKGRGMWGYLKASVKVLFKNPAMKAKLQLDDRETDIEAAMIVIANATKYGSGALINPEGRLDDDLFEVVTIKQISGREIFKMVVTHSDPDKEKTEIFQTRNLKITLDKPRHFQVDGEYCGKIVHIEAQLLPAAISIVVPLH
ncbi:MAG: diacylglycerol kinase family protein [Ferruginibacter sp.]